MKQDAKPDDRSDVALQGRICDALDASLNAYDAETRHALRQARQRAAEQAGSGWSRFRNLAIGSAVAVPAMLAVFLMVSPGQPPLPLEPVSVEVLAMVDDVEFFADLEFYEWLAEEQR